MNEEKSYLSIILVVIISAAIAIAIKTVVVMLVWGWVMVPTFGLPDLTFWQSFGVSVMVHILTYHSSK